MIDINNLSKTYITLQSSIKAVDNISLKIEKGDISGIIDFSGADGLGSLAVRFGYMRFRNDIMLTTIAILVLLVQVI